MNETESKTEVLTKQLDYGAEQLDITRATMHEFAEHVEQLEQTVTNMKQTATAFMNYLKDVRQYETMPMDLDTYNMLLLEVIKASGITTDTKESPPVD